MPKEHDFVDLLKFIGSIMIFAMHTAAFSSYGRVGFIWEMMSRWAVPLFFMLSSFFLFSAKNGNINRNHIKKYITRISSLYLVWFIYNIPSFVYLHIISNHSYTIRDLVIVLKKSILSSTFTGSWYLTSSIFCAFAVYILNKKFSTIRVICFAFVIQLLCIFTSVYRGILPTQVAALLGYLCFPLNIFGGFFYFSLGLYFAKHQELVSRIKTKYCIVIMLCSFALYVLEISLAKHFSIYGMSDQAFSIIPLSLSIFIIGIRSSIKIKNAKELRKMSTIVYCAQGNILLAKNAISKFIGIRSSVTLFICCVFMMSFVIEVVFFLQKKHIRWAKYLT